MTKLRKLRKLRPSDATFAARAYYYLLLAGWQLFIRRRDLSSWISLEETQPDLSEKRQAHMERAARWTNRAARLPLPIARCLQRSLALCLWLREDGYNPELKIGVRRDGAKLDAHAWVEYRGIVINDKAIVQTMFPQLRSARVGSPKPIG